jgi:hypothetical protein
MSFIKAWFPLLHLGFCYVITTYYEDSSLARNVGNGSLDLALAWDNRRSNRWAGNRCRSGSPSRGHFGGCNSYGGAVPFER